MPSLSRVRYLGAVLLAVLAVAGAGAAAVLLAGGDRGAPSGALTAATASPSIAVPPMSTPLPPTATPLPPTATPLPPTATPLPPTAPAASAPAAAAPTPTAPPQAARCETSVTLSFSFPESYYYVSGSTLDEIARSLVAASTARFGSFPEGIIVGLTEFPPTVQDSYCDEDGACALGPMSIAINGRVTLPRHSNPDAIAADARPVWDDFVQRVTVHEYRHVTIVKEELAILRDQLLALPPAATCEQMEHDVERTWFWGWRAMRERQEAFHRADAIGAGNLVAR